LRADLSRPGRRPTLLIVGCGDVGLRVLRALGPHWRVVVLTSTPQRVPGLRAAGAIPLVGDLDDPASLGRLGALADWVLHLAPPPAEGGTDPRTAALVRALWRGGRARHLVYGSTSGVYGDCAGARIDETRAVAPATARARRRVDAEARLRHYGRASGCTVTVLRIPGIYALDRPGGDPRERLRRGLPVLQPAQDVYTNHVHADDLARACIAALLRGRPQRVVHASDDGGLKMGEHYDRVADLSGLPRPPRVTREEAAAQLGPMAMSFLGESRRLANDRLVRELRLRLRYPTVREALQAAPGAALLGDVPRPPGRA
jgi:nucleoside-diphosphate-sugar epimerase